MNCQLRQVGYRYVRVENIISTSEYDVIKVKKNKTTTTKHLVWLMSAIAAFEGRDEQTATI